MTDDRKRRKTSGRPRAFDRKRALEKAMEVFWRQGYETTSLTDLTAALGINPPSLYAAFGDKETLFLEAAHLYYTGPGSRVEILNDAPTARAAVEALMHRAAEGLGRLGLGCMLMTSAMNTSSAKVQKELAKYRAKLELGVRRRIEQGMAAGDVPAQTDARTLAKYYETVLQGMSTQAMDGASAKSLRDMVSVAMQAWPADDRRPARRPG